MILTMQEDGDETSSLEPSLQGTGVLLEDSSSRVVSDLCAVLLETSGCQLQRLSVCPYNNERYSLPHLPRSLMGMISMASSLEHLAVAIPHHNNMGMLTESIRSLTNLKVHSSTLQLRCVHAVVLSRSSFSLKL